MPNKKTHFSISLQFFASEDVSVDSSADVSTEDGLATDNAQESSFDSASAENDNNGNQLEEEFEKLIKGGKFENAFKKRTQGIIDKRFKSFKALEEAQAKQQPILNFLSEKYGIDSSQTELLLEKMQSENNKPENESVNTDKADTFDKNRYISEKAHALSKQWSIEGERLKKVFPDFDFKTELKNPAFTTLLKSGMPLRKVYTAIHSDELIKNAVSGTAKQVAEQTFNSIKANGRRVAENGLRGGAGFIQKTDVNSLTGQDIRDILKQVENGSKIRF